MSNQVIDVRGDLCELKMNANLLQKVPCSAKKNEEFLNLIKEGKSLPEGVVRCVDYRLF